MSDRKPLKQLPKTRRSPKPAQKARSAGSKKEKAAAKSTARTKAAPKARVSSPRNRGLNFGFLILVFLFLACTGVFMLVQHQYSVRCDLKTTRLETRIANEKSRQEALRLSLARLKSPGRVARIAGDELGLGEPTGVIYLKYARDANGNMVCQSTFEERTSPEPPPGAAQPEKTGNTQASVVEGPGGALTRR